MSGRALGALARGSGLLVTLAAAACATTHPFEREVEAGRYQDAARTFEADSALWSDPKALLLAGRLYGDHVLPTFDLERAHAALSRLTEAFPVSEEAEEARPLLTLMGEVARLREELGERTVELEGRLAQSDTLTASRAAAERDLQAMRRRVERLEAELEEARRELERLKAVDLRPRPGTPR